MKAERLLQLYDRVSEAPDAIPRLRRFILDLAVRGKLVEQDPSDEPAEELEERISEEISRLSRRGQARKPRQFPPLEPEQLPFKLPPGWVWSQISRIGLLSPRNDAEDDLVASFVPMPNISADYGVSNNHEPRLWSEIKKGYTHFAEGDVGLAKITPCFENGKSTVFRNLTGGIGSGTTELHIVRPLFVSPDYIVAFLKSPSFIGSGIPRMTGTAGQKRVPLEYFAASPFPLPPLEEQHRIVAKVDELMALCDSLEAEREEREATRDRLTSASLSRLTAPDVDEKQFKAHADFAINVLPELTTRPDQLKVLRQTILDLAVRGKLVEQDLNDEPASELHRRITVEKAGNGKRQKSVPEIAADALGIIPENWCVVPLIALGQWALGAGFPKNEQGRTEGAYFFLKVSDMNLPGNEKYIIEANNHIDESAATRMRVKIHPPGTIIFPKIGGAIATNKRRMLTRSSAIDNNCLGITFSSQVNLDWAYLFLTTLDFAKFQAGTAVPALQQSTLEKIPVALPPLTEQKRIVAKSDKLMAVCDQLERSLVYGQGVRSRLLEEMLT